VDWTAARKKKAASPISIRFLLRRGIGGASSSTGAPSTSNAFDLEKHVIAHESVSAFQYIVA
jgi:hypothetical protein